MTRRKTWWVIAVSATVFVLGIAALVVYLAPVFRVNTVKVSGTSRYDAAEIQDAAGIVTGENLLQLNADNAAAGVASLPWVLRATVHRSLPDTVAVDIEERTPVLYLGEGENAYLIDTTGVGFATGTPPEGTIQLADDASQEGDSIPGDVLGALITSVTALDDATRAQVASVTASTALQIEFTLRDGRTVYWGSSDRAAAKASAMRTVLTQEGQHWNVSDPELVTVK